MCAPTAATSYCFPVEHGAHASSPVPPSGPRFNRGSPDPAGIGNVFVTRS
jgi:hypothetical protein